MEYDPGMKLLLAPVPQSVDITGGSYTLARDRTIVLFGEAASLAWVQARGLRDAIERYAGVHWDVRAASGLAEREAVVASIDRKIEKREGYHLTIGEERIGIVARDGAGLAHGFATLTQLVRQFGKRLPQLHIEDHPDFPNRGVMLDISRDKVPTMATLYGLVDMLAEWKVNQFQLYMEHTFAYDQHRAVWKDASPITGEEMHGARRVLPRAVHRPRAEPELVRAHGALADRSRRTATWPRCRAACRCRTGRCCWCGRRSSARR